MSINIYKPGDRVRVAMDSSGTYTTHIANHLKNDTNTNQAIVLILKRYTATIWITQWLNPTRKNNITQSYIDMYSLDPKYLGSSFLDVRDDSILGYAEKSICKECLQHRQPNLQQHVN